MGGGARVQGLTVSGPYVIDPLAAMAAPIRLVEVGCRAGAARLKPSRCGMDWPPMGIFSLTRMGIRESHRLVMASQPPAPP